MVEKEEGGTTGPIHVRSLQLGIYFETDGFPLSHFRIWVRNPRHSGVPNVLESSGNKIVAYFNHDVCDSYNDLLQFLSMIDQDIDDREEKISGGFAHCALLS